MLLVIWRTPACGSAFTSKITFACAEARQSSAVRLATLNFWIRRYSEIVWACLPIVFDHLPQFPLSTLSTLCCPNMLIAPILISEFLVFRWHMLALIKFDILVPCRSLFAHLLGAYTSCTFAYCSSHCSSGTLDGTVLWNWQWGLAVTNWLVRSSCEWGCPVPSFTSVALNGFKRKFHDHNMTSPEKWMKMIEDRLQNSVYQCPLTIASSSTHEYISRIKSNPSTKCTKASPRREIDKLSFRLGNGQEVFLLWR